MKFKVGERVTWDDGNEIQRGEIRGFQGRDFLVLIDQDTKDGTEVYVPKTWCRRLVKKKERRRIWVAWDKESNRPQGITPTFPSPNWINCGQELVEFIEVRRPPIPKEPECICDVDGEWKIRLHPDCKALKHRGET